MSSAISKNWVRYTVAVLAVLALVSGKLLSQQFLSTGVENEAPFMFSLAAVMLSAWYGGMGPGVLATVLAALTGDFFFMRPTYHFSFPEGPQRIRLIMFVVEGGVISFLCHLLKTARLRAEINERETRTLQRDLLTITDSEQRRIGHDLHDGLGQHLTGIAFMTKLVEQRLAGKNLAESADARKISGMVNTAIAWTRDLARGLAPVNLDQEDGLPSTLRLMVESTAEMFDCNCTFEMKGTFAQPDQSVSIHLFRIVQEAINNAIKHARPAHVRVSLIHEPGKIGIRVEDDGIGIKSAGTDNMGMGLRIMNYRARMIAGKLLVQNNSPHGTIILCTCPLHIQTTSEGIQ